jgi:hypothetical protein
VYPERLDWWGVHIGRDCVENQTSSIGVMRILEREAHLARLTARLGEAGHGSGRFVLVAGEAGIGKTALVGAFLASLPRSAESAGKAGALT